MGSGCPRKKYRDWVRFQPPSSADSEDRRSSVETLSAMWPKLDSAKRQGHQLDIKLAFSPTHSFGFLVGIKFYY